MNTNADDAARGYGFTTADGSSHVEEKGLSKREHFAALAMQGLLCTMSHDNFPPNIENVSYCTAMAVSAADLLISELNK